MTPLSSLVERLRPDQLPAVPGRWAVGTGARALALAALASRSDRALLVVTPGEREAEELVDDLSLFHGNVAHLPAWETLPFEHVSPNAHTMAQRARARHVLAGQVPGSVVVAPVRAVIQRVSPSSVEPIVFTRGREVDLPELSRRLARAGYHRSDRVETRGEFAVRGGIVDIFPAQADAPVRIDLWGDEVEDLRIFSVASQRSADPVDAVEVYPARELRPEGEVAERAARLVAEEPWAAGTFERLANGQMFPGMESWLPWLVPERSALDEADGAAVVLVDPGRSRDRARDLMKEEQELAAALAPTWGERAPEAGEHPLLYGDLDPRGPVLEMPAVPSGPGDPVLETRGFDATAGDPESVAGELGRLVAQGMAVVVAMDGEAAASRVSRVLEEQGMSIDVAQRYGGASVVLPIGIHHGFVAPGPGMAVLGEQEVAGRRRSHRRAGRTGPPPREDFGDLVEGDYVVHHQHGIGRFEGLVSRTMAGVEREYLVVAYHGGDRLYVPTDQLAAVT
ncbi:MAG: CarD family transcriptional regulator, partial [Actinomycetota bacterium]